MPKNASFAITITPVFVSLFGRFSFVSMSELLSVYGQGIEL